MQQNNSVTLFVTLSRRSLASLDKSENNHPFFVIKITAATQTAGYTLERQAQPSAYFRLRKGGV